MRSIAAQPLPGCTRRQALTLLAAGAGMVAMGPELALAASPNVAPPSAGRPVIAYFLDGLVRDPSGRLPAYRAPRGFGGGRGVARLDEAAMRMNGIQF